MTSGNKDFDTDTAGLFAAVPDAASDGPDLLRRWDGHQAFWDRCLEAGFGSASRVILSPIRPEVQATDRSGRRIDGINFASADHLSLAAHPVLRDAAASAADQYGVHAGGPVARFGGSVPLTRLEERLAEFLSCREATVFPTGWAAGYGTIRALISQGDHVVIDSLAHTHLHNAAAASTRNIHRVPHADAGAFLRRLASIRSRDERAGILAVTESVFPVDGSVPDLIALHDACRAHGATLLVWMGHDLGSTGDGGLGLVGRAGLLGEIDILVGSLARVFASTGGFVASDAPGVKLALRLHAPGLADSSAMSPVQAAIALAALDIVRSAEGARRRRRLAANVRRLRDGLAARAFEVLGQPGAVVPVLLGDVAIGRAMTRAMQNGGALVDLVEHPAVSHRTSRWALKVMADHRDEQIDRLIAIAVTAREQSAAAAEGAMPGCNDARPRDVPES